MTDYDIVIVGGGLVGMSLANALGRSGFRIAVVEAKEWRPSVASNQEGRTVFVDFTAAWCVTCQFNKRVVLNREAVQSRFREAGVVTMVADWTNRDPQISAALDSLGRSGVPVYVFYTPDNRAPILLPELLTETLVLDGIEQATQTIRTAAGTQN